MLYHLLYPLYSHFSAFNIFRYITFRSVVALTLATLASLILGKYFISSMQKIQMGQIVRLDGPKEHFKKNGTPTMGGLFFVGSIFIALLFCGNFLSPALICAIIVLFSYFCLGLLDDMLKFKKKNSKGVSAKIKLLWQILTSALVLYYMIETKIMATDLHLPFLKDSVLDLGYWYILFGTLVIVGTSNAVNLTDGLDGLAVGSMITSALTLGILAYIVGHREMASYLFIGHIPNVGELSVLMAATIGAALGFLWYNAHPAQVFMGDIGSLSIGGMLGTVAVMTKNEFLFVLIGGVFVVEALSVILQVLAFKIRKKRIFKMAPIHHHFELLGWPEPKVITRFWIINILLAIVSLATLKIR